MGFLGNTLEEIAKIKSGDLKSAEDFVKKII